MEKLAPILIVVVILLLIPILLSLRSKPMDFERIETEFRRDGLSVTSVESVSPPQADSRAHLRMRVNASDIDVFLFKDEETLEKQLKLLEKMARKKDAGSYTSGGISEAAHSKTARNGLYALVIRSRNEQVSARVVYLFESL